VAYRRVSMRKTREILRLKFETRLSLAFRSQSPFWAMSREETPAQGLLTWPESPELIDTRSAEKYLI
jgi:hypothetical protein